MKQENNLKGPTLKAPRKRFGQHFLEDPWVLAAIMQALRLQPHDQVIEIGPGRGALTFLLLKQLNQLTVIELDRDLVAWWAQQALPALTLLQADVLTVAFNQWVGPVRLVGNLPYNIATALLIHLLDYLDNIQDIQVMVQKEVADRLTAQPGSKAYGRLTVLMQTFCDINAFLEIPPEAFYPPPRVWSTMIQLKPHACQPIVDRAKLENVLLHAFSMRRKTLMNNLKKWITSEGLRALGINPEARPETISVQQYHLLAEQWTCLSNEKERKSRPLASERTLR